MLDFARFDKGRAAAERCSGSSQGNITEEEQPPSGDELAFLASREQSTPSRVIPLTAMYAVRCYRKICKAFPPDTSRQLVVIDLRTQRATEQQLAAPAVPSAEELADLLRATDALQIAVAQEESAPSEDWPSAYAIGKPWFWKPTAGQPPHTCFWDLETDRCLVMLALKRLCNQWEVSLLVATAAVTRSADPWVACTAAELAVRVAQELIKADYAGEELVKVCSSGSESGKQLAVAIVRMAAVIVQRNLVEAASRLLMQTPDWVPHRLGTLHDPRMLMLRVLAADCLQRGEIVQLCGSSCQQDTA